MEKPFFRVKLLDERAKLPFKRDEDAGYDIYAVLDEKYKILMPGEIFLFPTKISMEFPQDWVFYIAERSSTGTKGISKRCGIIDSGFRGELFVPINNTSNKPILFFNDKLKVDDFLEDENLSEDEVTLYPLTKAIAQGMLLYCPHVEVEEIHELSDSMRGDGALGSSNK